MKVKIKDIEAIKVIYRENLYLFGTFENCYALLTQPLQVLKKGTCVSKLSLQNGNHIVVSNNFLQFHKKSTLISGNLYKPSKIKNGVVKSIIDVKGVFNKNTPYRVKNGHVSTNKGHFIKTDEKFKFVE